MEGDGCWCQVQSNPTQHNQQSTRERWRSGARGDTLFCHLAALWWATKSTFCKTSSISRGNARSQVIAWRTKHFKSKRSTKMVERSCFSLPRLVKVVEGRLCIEASGLSERVLSNLEKNRPSSSQLKYLVFLSFVCLPLLLHFHLFLLFLLLDCFFIVLTM